MLINSSIRIEMISLTLKIWFLLVLVTLSSLLSACKGASNGAASGVISVAVTDYSGARVPNATVVLGDRDGSMKTYGSTDASGQIMFTNAPVNATITAANTCLRSGSTTTQYSIDIHYDINGSAVLTIDNCSDPPAVTPGPATELGTLTVNVTNIPANVTQDNVIVGQQSFSISGLITKQTLTLTTNDLDANGKFSILIVGSDATYALAAYGILLNQTFSNGMTIDVPMEPASYMQYQISNIPNTATYLMPSIIMQKAGLMGFGWGYLYTLASASSSTTISVPYIPGFTVNCGIDIDLDQDRDGVDDSRQGLMFNSLSTPLSSQSFDMSVALSAPSVTVTDADTARPTFSWSGVDPTVSSISLNAFLRSSTTGLIISPYNLSRARTGIKYPELPDSLAPFRPNKVDSISIYTSVVEGNIIKSSSGIYQ